MSDIKELLVNRSDYRKTRAIERPQEILAPRQIRVAVEKFAITSNNVSYAVSGDAIGYWRFFPAEEGWARCLSGGSARWWSRRPTA